MEASRFDAFARALSLSPSRRDFVRNLAIGAGAVLALRPVASNADTGSGGAEGGSVTIQVEPTPTPGTVDGADAEDVPAVGSGEDSGEATTAAGTNAVCLPIARVGGEDGFLPPFAAEIIEGTCDTAAGEVVFDLLEVDAADGVTAIPPAAFMTRSVTTVQSALDDLIDERHSILIRENPDSATIIACGEIGGIRQGDELTVGIKERTNSGYSGVSLIRGTNGSSLVYVFLGRGLSTVSTAPAAIGTSVITNADVNLRAQPAVDSEILAVIPTGTVLSVTGESVGEWVPVTDTATGNSGYVSGQFVDVQE